MDEETRRYLDDMRRQINDGIERILNRLGSLETDFTNTKGFLVSDALVSGRRWPPANSEPEDGPRVEREPR